MPGKLRSRSLALALSLLAPVALSAEEIGDLTHYRFVENTNVVGGCVGTECRCPELRAPVAAGELVLTLVAHEDGFDLYEVSDFLIEFSDIDGFSFLAGGGLYRRSVATEAPLQQLTLDVVGNDGETRRFDSGLVTASLESPQLAVSVYHRLSTCTGLLITLVAEPDETVGSGTPFVRGDCNADGEINIADALFWIFFLILGGPPEPCQAACDTNADGSRDLSDPIYLLNSLFLGGPLPAAPHPECGVDPFDHGMPCDRFAPCS